MLIKGIVTSALFATSVMIAPAWAGSEKLIMVAQDQTAAAGANSFTENQAKGRIEAAGYAAVSELKKDDKGVWRGTGTKDGKPMPVGLDFKGNVVTQ